MQSYTWPLIQRMEIFVSAAGVDEYLSWTTNRPIYRQNMLYMVIIMDFIRSLLSVDEDV
jgi:hypothetical protein